MDSKIVEGIRKRHFKVHPLIFHRSVEYARDATHLFDILESMPKRFPIVWDEATGVWVFCRDITLQKKFLENYK